jgi:uncharacterized protein
MRAALCTRGPPPDRPLAAVGPGEGRPGSRHRERVGPTPVPRTPAEAPEPGVGGPLAGTTEQPGAFGGPPGVVETHISLLFFVGDRVYKLRKPVRFGFLDFGQRATRQADCQREVVLNRRLAPDVYLGVADVAVEGVAVDHLVVMRRMPEDRRLATLARDGLGLDDWLEKIAAALVAFHDSAARSPEISLAGTGPSLRAGWEANFAECDRFVGGLLDEDIESEIRSLARSWIAGREPLLASRIAAGRVCDGHGDLQAEDIFCLQDGVRVLDCVEFSDQLRYGDVIADTAFLAMDLERLGCAEAAARFLRRYQEISTDRFPGPLVHHYSASRAYVRAKVACLRSAQGSDGARDEARRLQELALAHLRSARVRLVLVGGLPGSGKSTIGAGLAMARGMTLLRSDQIRTEGRPAGSDPPPGADPPPGYGRGRYRAADRAQVYGELLKRADACLGSGESVVLDASWNDAGWRQAARDLAQRTSSELVELCCVVDQAEAVTRIRRRSSEHSDVSEATPEVRAAMSHSMDPWESAIVLDSSGLTPEEVLARALAALGAATGPATARAAS